MVDYEARVAPFINVTFYVTSQAGVYPDGSYHSGLDISTGTGEKGANLYSICNGSVVAKNYDEDGYGNYIIIKDDESEWAFLFAHMYEASNKNVGDTIKLGEQFGIEGATGNVTGLHTHIEMQNYVNNGNKWIFASSDSSLWGVVYFPATDYMGFPNELGISVIYNGEIPPEPEPVPTRKGKTNFKWVLYSKKLRNKRSSRSI